MKIDFKEHVESRLTRDDDKELFRDLWETYCRGGEDEVKKQLLELIKNLSEV